MNKLKPTLFFLGLLLVSLALIDCGSPPVRDNKADTPPRVLIISSLIGYVEPCGCTADLLLGGIDRITAMIENARAQGPTAVLLVGPYLFEKAVEAHRIPQEKAKARLIARSLEKMGVDAVVNTDAERIHGQTFFDEVLKSSRFPDISLAKDGVLGRVIKLGSINIGVLGLADAKAPSALDPAQLSAHVQRLRKDGAQFIMGLAHLPAATIRTLAQSTPGVDVWVLSDHPRERRWMAPMKGAYLIEAGDRGRNLGQLIIHGAELPGAFADPVGDKERSRQQLLARIEFQKTMMKRTGMGGMGNTIKKLEAELASLPPVKHEKKRIEFTLLQVSKEVEPNPVVSKWLDAYNEQLSKLNLAHAGQIEPVPEGGSGFSGISECRDCHEDAENFWKTTAHARAWKTLVDGKKTFDSECVGCHVTGWQQPGGTILGQTQDLENVQCEVCHGAASKHVDTGGEVEFVRKNAGPSVCKTCHNAHHSPGFDYTTYRPRIIGPGHGAPMP